MVPAKKSWWPNLSPRDVVGIIVLASVVAATPRLLPDRPADQPIAVREYDRDSEARARADDRILFKLDNLAERVTALEVEVKNLRAELQPQSRMNR